jgi:DNA helicase-2/ATP-dependent DNA helicase PcrA
MSNKVRIILGPPGTGKTERLLRLVEQSISQGARPEEIGFLTFTKKAADEAKQRAINKFKISENSLVYFRTIHSLAFRQLSLSKIQVMQRDHYRELGDILGIDIRGSVNMDEGSTDYSMSVGDRLIFMEGLARAKMISLREQWEQGVNEDIDWWELERTSKALKKYKENNGLLDFTDMLEIFYKHGYAPKLKVLFIDEAQDLSKLQWLAVNNLIAKADKVYVAGDDDQCIFAWAGSDTEYFINLEGSVEVLDESFRVPRLTQLIAHSIVNQIQRRRPKMWKSRAADGDVVWHNDIDTVPLEQGEWLLLARNGYMLKTFEDHCVTNGFSFDGKRFSPLKSPSLTSIRYWEQLRKGEELTPEQVKKVNTYLAPELKLKNVERLADFNKVNMGLLKSSFGLRTEAIWHEALGKISPYEREYFIAARRRGETLVNKPRIRISTIHGAKGGEAENVLLMTDLAPRTFDEMQMDMDNELRVFYVGVTRAKKTLHLLQPQTNLFFNI